MAASVRISLLFYLAVIAFNSEVSAQSIVSPAIFQEGSTVTITCSADAVNLQAPGEDKVYSVALSRRLYSSDTVEQIFSFSALSYYAKENHLEQNILGQGWNFTFPKTAELEEGARYDRNVVKGVLKIDKATCQDSGAYICVVTHGPQSVSATQKEVEQQLNGTVVASDMSMTIVPDYDDDRDGDAVYLVNTTITMKCVAKGPEDYEFNWRLGCPNQFNNQLDFSMYPVQNDIQEHKKEAIANNQCGVTRHEQDLTFDMSSARDNCMIRCWFGPRGNTMNAVDSMSRNFTYLMEAVTTDSPAGKSSGASSGSSDDLVIGLTVSLLLLAIIVVAVLLYVCWWRKRTPQDKYKDEPDVGRGDNHGHEPPPVFYSKPHKAPKNDVGNVDDGGMTNKGLDHSYDSRDGTRKPRHNNYDDDGHVGGGGGDDDYVPPRYANQEPYSTGPPNYNSHDEPPFDNRYDQPPYEDPHNTSNHDPYDDREREAPRSRQPYVGHQNTAYDGGEPEPEGRKYTRGRARSNRSDRLNSSRSTEDGSLSIGPGMGDVNMGTAI